MTHDEKALVQTLALGVLFVVLCVILIPPLIQVMGRPLGKILYGVLVVGGVGLAFRLRSLSRRI